MCALWNQGHFAFYDPSVKVVSKVKKKRRIYPIRLETKTATGEKYLLIVYMGIRRKTSYFYQEENYLCKQCKDCRFFIPRSEILEAFEKVASEKFQGTKVRNNIEGICVWWEFPETLTNKFDLHECMVTGNPPCNYKLSRDP